MHTPTAIAILGLATWCLFTLLVLASYRVFLTLAAAKPANSFAPDGSDVPGFGQRLVRVHANGYENIPLYVGVMVYAIATEQTAITDPGAMMLLWARVAQGVVHAASTSIPAVLLRFAFFALQAGILASWIWRMAVA